MTFTNGLTDAQLERLALLSEELGEAQQAIGKIIRHGFESKNPNDVEARLMHRETNRERLETEMGDVCAALEMLMDAGDLNASDVSSAAAEKHQSAKPWLHHQA